MPDLALRDQLLDRSGDVFDRDVRVDAVLVEEVDAVGAQAAQRGLDDALDRSGRLSSPFATRRPEVEAELRRDHDLIAHRRERLTDELLVREGAVDLGGVEEGDAALTGVADQLDRLLPGREPWP